MKFEEFYKVEEKRKWLSIGGIYKIKNTVNGKSYIGQSVNIYKRWLSHKHDSLNVKDKIHYHYPLYRAFRKYGLDKFDFTVIEECKRDKDILNEREFYWLKHYNCFVYNNIGYNQWDYFKPGERYHSITKEQLWEITEELLHGKLLKQELADKYNIGRGAVSAINNGDTYYREELTYPLRELDDRSFLKTIDEDRYKEWYKESRDTEAVKQAQKNSRKLPDISIVLEDLKTLKFDDVGRKYGVSSNSVRHYLKVRGYPYHAKDYASDAKKKLYKSNYVKSGRANSIKCPVAKLDSVTEAVEAVFLAMADAERSVNGTGGVKNCANGKQKTAYGFKWKKLTEEEYNKYVEEGLG